MSFIDDWKEWSKAKKAISIIAVCCVGILIIGILMGGGTPDKNTQTTSDSNADDAADQPQGVQIHIKYNGEWQGAAGSDGSTNSISGSGEKTIDLDKDATIVSANAQKKDSGNGKLTIEILKDGKVIKDSSTDAEYGVASVSATV